MGYAPRHYRIRIFERCSAALTHPTVRRLSFEAAAAHQVFQIVVTVHGTPLLGCANQVDFVLRLHPYHKVAAGRFLGLPVCRGIEHWINGAAMLLLHREQAFHQLAVAGGRQST